ncbi:MAG: hypothetical protein U0556_10720 [Dehalococcoidia bacterium]
MRGLVGCLVGGLLACILLSCVGGAGSLFYMQSAGPGVLDNLRVPGSSREPVITKEAAESFDRKVQEFNDRMASAQPNQPATLMVSSDEVSSKIAQETQLDQLRESGVEIENVRIDFRDNRAHFAAQIRADQAGQVFGITGKLNLVPVRNGEAIRVDFDELNIVGVLPLPIPLASVANSGPPQDREIPLDFRVDSITMSNGQLTIVGRPR